MESETLKYKDVPGRGLMTQSAYQMRLEFLKTLMEDSGRITSAKISLEQVQNNIESFIGTSEIPLGLAGPLLFKSEKEKFEWVYAGICTTEGALVASMNRGAKAISECGGFSAHFVHQKMLRAPLFTFKEMADALIFEKWIKENFGKLKSQVSKYSNHAELTEIKYSVIGKLVNLKFIYTTADASGQNMVTYCTWELCQWINEIFPKQSGIGILKVYADGNGSSDKKVSYYAMQNGRGAHVVCECFLSNEIIVKTLRTTAREMFQLYNHSMAIARFDGIIGGTINIANAIAGIFAATGQDLGCIHESSLGILQLDELNDGLYLSLSIPALVIGTIGGGTHLPGPRAVLELMNCCGKGKLERFAKLIAGFSLSLEVSTLAALASGQFARAHQKLGKNKTLNWLIKSEIDIKFIKKHMDGFRGKELISVELLNSDNLCNGILTNLAARATKKMIGFITLQIHAGIDPPRKVLIKSKPLDEELMLGLYLMASRLNADLADSLLRHKEFLEYKDSHQKEIDIYQFLKGIGYPFIPEYYGEVKDVKREIYLFMIEYLDDDFMETVSSENDTGTWSDELIINAFRSIHTVHKAFLNSSDKDHLGYLQKFDATHSLSFYEQCNQVNQKDYREWEVEDLFDEIAGVIQRWRKEPPVKKSRPTLVHNDFNSRNIGIRKNGNLCIYDWELAVINIPHRDIFEFLAFTLDVDNNAERLHNLMKSHYEMLGEINGKTYAWKDYIDDFIISGHEFLITRASFYLAGNTLLNYSFIKRVFISSNRIIKHAETFYERI